MPYLYVGLGGFLGANARFIVAFWMNSALGVRFPIGTMFINVTGSFLLGLAVTFLTERLVPHSAEWRNFICIGFLGGYTTFSTFAFESLELGQDAQWGSALVNMVLSVVLSLVAVQLGVVAARRWL
ncbi:MAG: fluoride efflux transporter CrcB [Armatimonadetes bacterium]|nr:fluoride efflux transporter CrcB [Armatimonadota bacterium]